MVSDKGPPPVPGWRSPDERERARLEREARRRGAPRPPQGGHQRPPSTRDDGSVQGAGPTPPRPGDGESARGGSPTPPVGDGDSGRGRSILRAGLLLGLLLIFGLVAFAAYGFVAPGGNSGERVRVSIPKGASVGDIARTLDERGIVSSALFFETRATVSGDRGALKAGSYTLPAGADHDQIVSALSAGPAPKKIRTVNVTIPEGRSRREIASSVADAGLKGSYAKASLRSPVLSPRSYGAKGAGSLEGFLFPATYEVRAGASARTLVRKQLQTFEREWEKIDLRRSRRARLTQYEVLVIASMVEREAQVARERPLIASVIYNRLRDGMPLGIDATVRYATRNWTKPLTQSELAIESPYNTRARAGLPPGPIGNPGLASMRAAAKPARSDYRYYVVKPNACGEHAFSTTLAEFTEDSSRYNAERAKRGGRSPTDC